ncbi:MAG TPA: hypothetical protein VJX92_06950 [Methylomirabilota bacterium]|nr:hypothetical protein [Methylomirabilota bacterium]
MSERIFGVVPPMTTGLHERLLPIWNAIAHDNLPANVKHCQALMGRPAGVPRAPMPATSTAQVDGIRQALHAAGVLA